ncbi:MAG: hypothetical protein M1814_001687 [Vezdaea aestivalis]|nr:MAG: hypothetical protein M1814_001687 [Vezdaea aestivalis]
MSGKDMEIKQEHVGRTIKDVLAKEDDHFRGYLVVDEFLENIFAQELVVSAILADPDLAAKLCLIPVESRSETAEPISPVAPVALAQPSPQRSPMMRSAERMLRVLKKRAKKIQRRIAADARSIPTSTEPDLDVQMEDAPDEISRGKKRKFEEIDTYDETRASKRRLSPRRFVRVATPTPLDAFRMRLDPVRPVKLPPIRINGRSYVPQRPRWWAEVFPNWDQNEESEERKERVEEEEEVRMEDVLEESEDEVL